MATERQRSKPSPLAAKAPARIVQDTPARSPRHGVEEIANTVEGVAEGLMVLGATLEVTESPDIGWFVLLLERTLRREAKQLRTLLPHVAGQEG